YLIYVLKYELISKCSSKICSNYNKKNFKRYFCNESVIYVPVFFVSLEVQEIVATEQHQIFNELMTWLCIMLLKERMIYYTSEQQVTKDQLIYCCVGVKAKCILKLELDYAAECKVPARKRLKQLDERLMEILLDSLNRLVCKLVYEQNPTTLEETEEALALTQNRFEEIQG
ncbi:hypothetical protein RFI_38789, partial [Reticulomyxa filosa]